MVALFCCAFAAAGMAARAAESPRNGTTGILLIALFERQFVPGQPTLVAVTSEHDFERIGDLGGTFAQPVQLKLMGTDIRLALTGRGADGRGFVGQVVGTGQTAMVFPPRHRRPGP